MNELIFRLATVSDIEGLIELRCLMQSEVNQIQLPDIDANFKRITREYLLKALPAKTYFSHIALNKGKPVAANGLVFFDKPPSLKARHGRIAYVTNVYTMKEFRKQGIATKLMQMLVQTATEGGADLIQLGARASAQPIYEKIGFKFSSLPTMELKL